MMTKIIKFFLPTIFKTLKAFKIKTKFLKKIKGWKVKKLKNPTRKKKLIKTINEGNN